MAPIAPAGKRRRVPGWRCGASSSLHLLRDSYEMKSGTDQCLLWKWWAYGGNTRYSYWRLPILKHRFPHQCLHFHFHPSFFICINQSEISRHLNLLLFPTYFHLPEIFCTLPQYPAAQSISMKNFRSESESAESLCLCPYIIRIHASRNTLSSSQIQKYVNSSLFGLLFSKVGHIETQMFFYYYCFKETQCFPPNVI